MAILCLIIFIYVFTTFTPQSALSDSTTVRIYDSFAEICKPYNGPLRFRQVDWDNIKHESIVLQSASDTNNTILFVERRIVRINSNMIGKNVFVRKYAEQQNSTVCQLIKDNGEYSVVREIETGRYMRVQSDLIEYSHEPQSSSIYEVSFHPFPSAIPLTVTYVVNSLRWTTRYILRTFADGRNQFQILADIINSSPFNYHFNVTHLMAGEISLAFGSSKSSSLVATTISSKNNMDYSGIHLFSLINKSLTIEPNSILTLPIILPQIQIKISYTHTLIMTIPSIISNSDTTILSGKHKFQRLYQISNSSSFLPTGHLLLYDSSVNVLTGECNLPTLAESEKYEFELGQDSDIMLVYNRTLTTNRATNSTLVTTNVLVQNYKQRKVNIRLKSICQLSMTCVFYDNKGRTLGSRLRYELVLQAKSEVGFTFSTIRMAQQN
ncbi:unnamed protein product [Rotaria socialis]|uniref:DUF4139 domain-containing protein n=2 Tax=Rotaria socialis TaxID=392032 RepID=A0A818SNB4_9BILA|nr:unnamed protein product [Rotaria socialis]CAF3673618.1 unnamed protein product [Rotaria socialis]CAF3749357.1 unnamed protein product [Rotaria socialis]CAF4567222.1 unnamed protein product [Rotaria socialis]CAF4779127.1 unnamed protein product [Rotaria socialis]